jgi:hypothetical protein
MGLRHGGSGGDDAAHDRQQQRKAPSESEPLANLAARNPGIEGALRSFQQPRLRQLHQGEVHDLFIGRQLRLGRHSGGQAGDRRVAVSVPPHARCRCVELVHAQRVFVEQQAISVEFLDDDVRTSRFRLHAASPYRQAF